MRGKIAVIALVAITACSDEATQSQTQAGGVAPNGGASDAAGAGALAGNSGAGGASTTTAGASPGAGAPGSSGAVKASGGAAGAAGAPGAAAGAAGAPSAELPIPNKQLYLSLLTKLVDRLLSTTSSRVRVTASTSVTLRQQRQNHQIPNPPNRRAPTKLIMGCPKPPPN
ncbi:MAG TPA: hypothetical protein VHW01_13845 [Polyangiaceae bacterium]|nr:hypothetical protein [Polyangiaceae bacterium]